MTFKPPITQLTDTLWTGGDLPDGAALPTVLAEWQACGIGVIIDCRAEWSDEDFVTEFAPEIRYEHVGIDDIGQVVSGTWFDQVLDAATPRPTDAAPGVLAHCHMGINRGPSAAYALLLSQGHDPIEAIEMIRGRRPIAGVSYAPDALDWWHDRNGTPVSQARAERDALTTWRRTNHLDTIRLLRSTTQI